MNIDFLYDKNKKQFLINLVSFSAGWTSMTFGETEQSKEVIRDLLKIVHKINKMENK